MQKAEGAMSELFVARKNAKNTEETCQNDNFALFATFCGNFPGPRPVWSLDFLWIVELGASPPPCPKTVQKKFKKLLTLCLPFGIVATHTVTNSKK
jgi:hypothetical protein